MAEALDQQISHAAPYAAALFELAQSAGSIDATRMELEELLKLCEIEPGFSSFLTSPALDDDHRAAGLEKMFRGKLSDLVLNTLLVMNWAGRTGALHGLYRGFVHRAEEAAGQIEVTATSATELDERQKREIAEAAAELSGRKPVIRYIVDPSILGGLVLQIGDLRYDNSVRRKLQLTRERLLERSETGLGVVE